ncbi:putrescine hydroxycinnamoyltransferase 1-like [Triticum dicoccoides]|uniref:putrescine hydroxycinnamoyltransferase 1-like n=1 Tax=Triticum dicoccoides TaxID=85692 RepID=UPI00189131BB|nr:putrescine hydroxycinnamoyltransferase 1-like [Triticum dicoccoides]
MYSGSALRVVESCLVTPSDETPRGGLWLSALDLVLANRGHTPLVHVYSASDVAAAGGFFNVAKLKKSMAKALVPFYPLAGRLGADGDGRMEIDCNGKGALFVVARSDRTVEDFSGPSPSSELTKLFCPRVQPSSIMLAAQVTFLKCGGVVLGTAVHHAAVDGSSAFHFIGTWARYCRDGQGAVIELPCHDRALLRARSPPAIHPETVSMFCSKLAMHEHESSVATKVITISGDQLYALKRHCGGASTFCVVSALVWQCVCIARQLDPDATTRMNFPVDIRHRVKPRLPGRYFGNGVVNVFATAAVKDVVSETLASIVSRVKATTEKLDDELLRSAVDYFEMEAAKGGRPEERGNLPEMELRMNSWFHLPIYDANFGWGKPWVMTRAETVRGGWVYVMAGCGDGSARVLISLEVATLKRFERSLAVCRVQTGIVHARL